MHEVFFCSLVILGHHESDRRAGRNNFPLLKIWIFFFVSESLRVASFRVGVISHSGKCNVTATWPSLHNEVDTEFAAGDFELQIGATAVAEKMTFAQRN